MKAIFIFLIVLLPSTQISAQDSTLELSRQHYLQLKNFLSSQKNNVDVYTSVRLNENSTSCRQHFEEWFKMTKKKGLAEAIQVDSRHMIQTMPINYSNKDLVWISPAKRYTYKDNPGYINASFGEQVKQDIINNIGSGLINSISKRKYHYRYSAADNKPSQTPSFLKF